MVYVVIDPYLFFDRLQKSCFRFVAVVPRSERVDSKDTAAHAVVDLEISKFPSGKDLTIHSKLPMYSANSVIRLWL